MKSITSFFGYQFDMQNLAIDGMANTLSKPTCDLRWEQVVIQPVNFEEFVMNVKMESLSKNLSEAPIEETTKFKCEKCPAKYTTAQALKRHMTSEHPESQPLKENVCKECGKELSSSSKLQYHVKHIHRKCKICNEIFDTDKELKNHTISKHPVGKGFCTICETDFKYESQLMRHMSKKHNL